MTAIENMTEDELREHTQGCSELTCIYHGPYTVELRNRSLKRLAENAPGARLPARKEA